MGVDFLCIGAQKSGTSWLYKQFCCLDSFSMPPKKEIHYFDRSPKYPSPNILSEPLLINRLKDPKWLYSNILKIGKEMYKLNYKNAKWFWNYSFANYHDRWYINLFENLDGIAGDITPAYAILEKEDIQHIYNLLGDIKIIFMLRNPVDRAWSAYKYKYRINKNIPQYLSIDHISSFINSNEQILRSSYLQTIHKFSEVFGNRNMILGFYDAIVDNPINLLKEIVNFIGGDVVSVEKLIDIPTKVNRSENISLPIEIRTMLNEIYFDDISKLNSKYGGYFAKWEHSISSNTVLSANYQPTIIV